MYMQKMLGVSKAENGYVVECYVPVKLDDDEKGVMPYTENECKQYIAKDMAEVSALIAKLMPLLDMEYKSEDDFDAAFKKGAKEKTREEY